MKRILALFLLLTFALSPILAKSYRQSSSVGVKGYTKRNGTYVAPHQRSAPDKSYNNNWTVRPNVNPSTGKPGTKQPTANDKAPTKN